MRATRRLRCIWVDVGDVGKDEREACVVGSIVELASFACVDMSQLSKRVYPQAKRAKVRGSEAQLCPHSYGQEPTAKYCAPQLCHCIELQRQHVAVWTLHHRDIKWWRCIPGRSSLVAHKSSGTAPTSAGRPCRYCIQSCSTRQKLPAAIIKTIIDASVHATLVSAIPTSITSDHSQKAHSLMQDNQYADTL